MTVFVSETRPYGLDRLVFLSNGLRLVAPPQATMEARAGGPSAKP